MAMGIVQQKRPHLLNWRLVQMPDAVRDYVLLHELMHLKRMDHSPKFWKLVGDVCPDFKAARAWLKAFSRTQSVRSVWLSERLLCSCRNAKPAKPSKKDHGFACFAFNVVT